MQYKDILLSIDKQESQELDGSNIMQNVKDGLKRRYGEEAFQSWFKNLVFVSSCNGSITVSVPTKFIKEWVCINYNDVILAQWQTMDSKACAIEICIEEEGGIHREMRELFPRQPEEQLKVAQDVRPTTSKQVSPILNSRLTFDNFVADKSNELALAAAQRVANAICPDRSSNPLFLYGGVGLGKTHLMHAIACHVHMHMPWKKVVYLTAENFMRQFIGAIRDKNARHLQDNLRSADILMIDDIQFIGGKEYTQEEFFHTFNDLVDSGKQLVISADRSPVEMESIKDRIKSRLSGGLIVDIGPTTFELRVGIMQRRLRDTRLDVPYDVIEYLAQSIPSNVRELEGAFNRLTLAAQTRSSLITLDFAHEIMDTVRVTKAPEIGASIEKITKIVADYYEVKVSEILSPKKDARIAKARQVAMYIIKKSSNLSLADIGKCLGGRNHTTVMYSLKKIEEAIDINQAMSQDVTMIMGKIKR